MKLPNLIIFGAIKSGTGALHQYLDHHPDIFMSPLKEPRYFMHSDVTPGERLSTPNSDTIRTLQDYADQFVKASSERTIGESSSGYIYSEFAANKIKSTIPDVRLVASLRNPVDRACAHFQMVTKAKKIDSSILASKSAPWAQSSLYYEKLRCYFDLFPQEQLKIMVYEEWITDTQQALRELYRFLGVDDKFELKSHIVYRPATVLWPKARQGGWMRRVKPYIPTRALMLINNFRARNIRPVEELIPADVRSAMNEWYTHDIDRLEGLLSRDLSIWRQQNANSSKA